MGFGVSIPNTLFLDQVLKITESNEESGKLKSKYHLIAVPVIIVA